MGFLSILRHAPFQTTNTFAILATKTPVFFSSTCENGNLNAPKIVKGMLSPVLHYAHITIENHFFQPPRELNNPDVTSLTIV
jgi:hypothetical protein